MCVAHTLARLVERGVRAGWRESHVAVSFSSERVDGFERFLRSIAADSSKRIQERAVVPAEIAAKAARGTLKHNLGTISAYPNAQVAYPQSLVTRPFSSLFPNSRELDGDHRFLYFSPHSDTSLRVLNIQSLLAG